MAEKRLSLSVRKERRTRVKKPPVLVILSLLIISLSVINYAGLSFKYGIPMHWIHQIYFMASVKEILFLILSIISGFGLLVVHRWGWYAFLISSVFFLIHNAYYMLIYPSNIQPGPVFQSLLILTAVVYFLQKDVYSPYLWMRRAGWRYYRRYSVSLPMEINGQHYLTKNMSGGGALLSWNDCDLEPGTGVNAVFSLCGITYRCEAGIVAADDTFGTGIAFRGFTRSQKNSIDKLLRVVAFQSDQENSAY